MSRYTRRAVLLGGVGCIAYSTFHGLRYPRLSLEPEKLDSAFLYDNSELFVDGLIKQVPKDNTHSKVEQLKLAFRAYVPEPQLKFKSGRKQVLQLNLNNLSADAKLLVTGVNVDTVSEHIEGIQRRIEIPLVKDQVIDLHWVLPNYQEFTFAAIGDTGGGVELEWCLQRAAQLGAKFLLHMGDINYTDGEYDSAIRYFEQAPIPCYISIGNHDFHDNGLIYDRFRENLGPMNTEFTLGGVSFVNIDTAADFFPASSGLRGELFKNLLKEKRSYNDKVLFTHRPFVDAREGQDHVIGGVGEIDWLAHSMKKIDCDTLLTGHVHRSAERDYEGLLQYTVGEGLGHQDVVKRKQVAQLLLGSVQPNSKVTYRWAELNMPWHIHQSPNHTRWLKDKTDDLDWYRKKMANL